jgi:iron complex transport system substrate-binding protein
MNKFRIPLLLILLAAGAFIGAVTISGNPKPDTNYNPAPDDTVGTRRIVSLAPSVTEVLFALGLGDRVVGVTRQCLYPPEARSKTKIGGYYDPNYEQIVRLKPDLVIMSKEQVPEKAMVDNLHIPVLVVDHMTVDGIVKSFNEIGAVCDASEDAAELAGDLIVRMHHVEEKTSGLPRPRVMVSLGRGMGSGALKDIFIAGKGTFYDDLITLSGGENVYSGTNIKFPQVEIEGICKLDPDVVIDMMLPGMNLTKAALLDEWKKAGHVQAVKNNRVYIFEQDYATVPGPRFILTLEQMARAIHPEIKWE